MSTRLHTPCQRREYTHPSTFSRNNRYVDKLLWNRCKKVDRLFPKLIERPKRLINSQKHPTLEVLSNRAAPLNLTQFSFAKVPPLDK